MNETLTDIELEAIEYGKDIEAVEKRVKSARSLLVDDCMNDFKGARFDDKTLSLIGKNWVLQWRIRPYPEEEISYRNQQTSQGVVVLQKHNGFGCAVVK